MQDKDFEQLFSNEAFASLGAPETVYIRPVLLPDGSKNFALHAANGQELAVSDTYEAAVATALSNELTPVSLH